MHSSHEDTEERFVMTMSQDDEVTRYILHIYPEITFFRGLGPQQGMLRGTNPGPAREPPVSCWDVPTERRNKKKTGAEIVREQ